MSGSEVLNMTDIRYDSEKHDPDIGDKETAIVPALFFILISFSWMIEENIRKKSSQKTIKPSCWVTKVSKYLPLMGVYMVTVSSISIIFTSFIISGTSKHVSSYAMITIYAAFSICGLINIIQFYVKTLSAVLPR